MKYSKRELEHLLEHFYTDKSIVYNFYDAYTPAIIFRMFFTWLEENEELGRINQLLIDCYAQNVVDS